MKSPSAEVLAATYIITLFIPLLFLYLLLLDPTLPNFIVNAIAIAATISLFFFMGLTSYITAPRRIHLPCGHSASSDSHFCPRCGTLILPRNYTNLETWPQ